ncbi:Eco57I restriction-modification methylase domain-containing protein [Microcystis aeruginosa]|uniref:site-specific DNA-methyltransferase (adenine-specific) n=1 Tax=Microcystis aeruginosa NIES-3807 TaxID=2517785 RepID=A0AAD3AZW9_MICAE|nr:N-6 DNA methylase [Microcystis aeruginosa]GCL59051.1 hypothetical protein NIES3807_22210 [Microcystis aeruginosa NIES-3807]
MNNATAYRIAGNLLASDMTTEIASGEKDGQSNIHFGLERSIKLEDEIAFVWGEAKDQWQIFQRRLKRLGESDTGTSTTREFWVIPLLKLLGYQPVLQERAETVDGQTFAISHRAGFGDGTGDLSPLESPPVHIVSCKQSLEQRPPSGRPRLSAHALVQEYLNRTEHLWGVVTNGLRWRLLRDCSLMTRLTFIEFDLEQIVQNENYAEFCLFYRLFHRTRLPWGVEDVDSCFLEVYHQDALEQGGRVRERLRDGVEQALLLLGTGFLQHRQNQRLREAINSRELSERDYYRSLLLLIYRLLFLMVAESRNLLLAGEDEGKARIYSEYYSVFRLRALAERKSYLREGFQDNWQGLRVTFSLFDESWRGELLGLSPLNGDLFGSNSLKLLEDLAIDNHDLLLAIRHLSLYENRGQLRRVNYAALDVEELGSVYESLLDFTPRIVNESVSYRFLLVIGSDRKTTGSYYTPPALVGQLIKSALEPVIADKLKGKESPEDKEKALLSLTVCDPACGSGHFLLAAARRIGKELARVRSGEDQPSPEAIGKATRDVIQNCIYGVDLNPLAVDLCKVALWIEGFCKGFPLNFLDHRIKCGNSLVGVMDLDVLKEGIPDEAYQAVTGDDQSLATKLKKSNKEQCKVPKGQLSLFQDIDFEVRQGNYAEGSRHLNRITDSTPAEYHRKQERYEELRADSQWWQDFSACNLWTAAFFMPLTEANLQLIPTTEALRRLLREAEQRQQRNPLQGSLFADGETSSSTPFSVTRIVEAANNLAREQRFFHWCLEFPEVFAEGGFSCVLGNPPWELLQIAEKEFFASKDESIANEKDSSKRKKQIQQLAKTNPQLLQMFENTKHDADAQNKFIRESGRFLLTLRGKINTYSVFAELVKNLMSSQGKSAAIIKSGIATDDSNKDFIQNVVSNCLLTSFFDFNNEDYIFKDIEHTVSFAILTLSNIPCSQVYFASQLRNLNQLKNPLKLYGLSSDEIRLFNPNTLNLPIFQSIEDLKLVRKIYQKVPVLSNLKKKENHWKAFFRQGLFNMTSEREIFWIESELITNNFNLKRNVYFKENIIYLPLYESKNTDQYNHRFAGFEGIKEEERYRNRPPINEANQQQLANVTWQITPRYWVQNQSVDLKIPEQWKYNWLIGFRNAINAFADSRSVRFTLIPKCGVGNSMPLIFSEEKPKMLCCLVANFNSLILDYVAKQKASGGNLNFYVVKQLPIIPPNWYTSEDIEYISDRVLELVYTAYDIRPFAEDMGYYGEPFIWDEDRRAKLRAELDAKYAKLYGLTRDELRYILDPADVYGEDFPSETFRVLKNNEMKKYGEYRTRRLVLEAWDSMK